MLTTKYCLRVCAELEQQMKEETVREHNDIDARYRFEDLNCYLHYYDAAATDCSQ